MQYCIGDEDGTLDASDASKTDSSEPVSGISKAGKKEDDQRPVAGKVFKTVTLKYLVEIFLAPTKLCLAGALYLRFWLACLLAHLLACLLADCDRYLLCL